MATLEETCQECSKVITRRAIAHVYDGRVVCTKCVHRLHAAEVAREKKAAADAIRDKQEHDDLYGDEEPATARQRRFAMELGINLPPDARKWQTSHLIDARLKQLHEDEEQLVVRMEPHWARHGLAPRKSNGLVAFIKWWFG